MSRTRRRRQHGAVLVASALSCMLSLAGCGQQPVAPSTPGGGVTTQPGNVQVPPTSDTSTTSRADLPDWTAAETELASLDAPFEMPELEFRPPQNFRNLKQPDEPSTYIWVGPVRDDETYAQLMIINTVLPEDALDMSLTDLLAGVTGSIQNRRENWSSTVPEEGMINGLHVIRTSWSGVVTGDARQGLLGRMMHGTVYLTVQNQQAIQFMCQDVAPNHVESLKLGELAASTFRAKGTQSRSQ